MIKEFWQERKEEKRKQKELKKQNKKNPKTREEKAYKIFGVFFTLFLIFGSIFSTCRCEGSFDNYSWDSIVGITDEIKSYLTLRPNKDSLVKNEEVNAIDWSICQDKLSQSGINVVVDNKIVPEKLVSGENLIERNLTLNSVEMACLISKIIETTSLKDKINLIDIDIYEEDNRTYARALFDVQLASIIISDSLPNIYITTISKLEILANQLYCMNSKFTVNELGEEENEKVLEVINDSSIIGIESYTSKLLADKINEFALCINANININDCKITFTKK